MSNNLQELKDKIETERIERNFRVSHKNIFIKALLLLTDGFVRKGPFYCTKISNHKVYFLALRKYVLLDPTSYFPLPKEFLVTNIRLVPTYPFAYKLYLHQTELDFFNDYPVKASEVLGENGTLLGHIYTSNRNELSVAERKLCDQLATFAKNVQPKYSVEVKGQDLFFAQSGKSLESDLGKSYDIASRIISILDK